MTEVEWLACEDSKRMFEFLQTALSTRKARLLAVGCCRLLGDVLSELQGAALDAGEAFADDPGAGGAAVEAERAVARANAGVYTRARQSAWAGTWWEWASAAAAGAVSLAVAPQQGWYETRWLPAVADCAARAAGCAARAAVRTEENANGAAAEAELAARAGANDSHRALARCVSGPGPFRPVPFSPEWRGATAAALAERMYESRDFSALPILADALQDSGCEIAEILEHCRGPGPHVRGCWAVDLVLGKE